jgi:hypothetical protein
MKRRKLLIGVGSAAGVGGLVGSGAFTSVSANRSVTIETAGDENAFLGLEPSSGPNGEYAYIESDGTLALDFSDTDAGGQGVGVDSIYQFDDVFRVTNQGTQTVYVWATIDFSGVDFEPGDIHFYPNGDENDKLQDTESVLGLPVGQSAEIGVYVDSHAVSSGGTLDVTIHANAEQPGSSTPVDEGGDDFVVVDASGGGDFTSIQNAIDSLSGSTVLVEPGVYEENVNANVSDLTLLGPNNGVPGDGSRGPEATVEGRFVASADNVVVDGFDISPPAAEANQFSEALRVSNTPNGVVVKNNVVREFERDAPGGGFYGVDGINVFGGTASEPIEDVTVVNNSVQSLRNEDQGGVAGISIQGNVAGATVENNTIAEIGEEVTSYGFGVTVRGTSNHGDLPSDVDVRNNDISQVFSDDASDFLGVGLGVESDGSSYTIEDNAIEDVDLGAEFKAAATETSLAGNTFSNTIFHLGDLTGGLDLIGVLSDNGFDGAAGVDSVEPNSIRPSGFDPYQQVITPEIQPGVDVASSGAEITADAGVYDEAVDIDTANATLSSLQGPSTTIIESGTDIRSGGVTIDGFEIRNPGTQGQADPGSPGGAIGVNVHSGNEDVAVKNNVITEIGTGDDDANPIGILSSDGTSGITVENNEISNLEGTDEDQGQSQAVLINESGTKITNATVSNNDISDLLDTRSTVAVRFNGDVEGDISSNDITGLNTEGDIPGSNGDPGGFTQVIALQRGGGSSTGPSDVTIEDNTISNIETTTPDNYAPPFHLILGPDTDGTTVAIESNSFNGDSQDDEIYVGDRTGALDLNSVQNNNSFTPAGTVTTLEGLDVIARS